eukprot:TRINITY_DN39854_c0_g1_i2.p1 TRINITY_DN39854_c0_g1~~TRINITY_DN39854_c0_g1_i2.p1  ORF type:complete len:371 (-),score=63.20 TRINITY_DN39854_c0_g1_i2:260-1372(-)
MAPPQQQADPADAAVAALACAAGHELWRVLAKFDGFVCSVCTTPKKGEYIFYCSSCDFGLCSGCSATYREPVASAGENAIAAGCKKPWRCERAPSRLEGGLQSVVAEMWYEDGPVLVDIFDGMADPGRFEISECGFALARLPSELTLDEFYDVAAVRVRHYAEVARLLKDLLKAVLVLPFNHTARDHDLRERQEGLPAEQQITQLYGPGYCVHNDQTSDSGWGLAMRKLEPYEGRDAVQAACSGRFAVVNTWRALAAVRRDPLALCDWRSMAPEWDTPSPGGHPFRAYHEWFYFKDMQPGDTLVFKQFDSAVDSAGYVLHTAFVDPTSPCDAPPRQSVDVRSLVFFDADSIPPNFGEAFLAAQQRAAAPE